MRRRGGACLAVTAFGRSGDASAVGAEHGAPGRRVASTPRSVGRVTVCARVRYTAPAVGALLERRGTGGPRDDGALSRSGGARAVGEGRRAAPGTGAVARGAAAAAHGVRGRAGMTAGGRVNGRCRALAQRARHAAVGDAAQGRCPRRADGRAQGTQSGIGSARAIRATQLAEGACLDQWTFVDGALQDAR